jgi:hypothetical protein
MVTGLPKINLPAKLCEECVKGKQHKIKFSKDVGHRTKEHLEVVYSDVCGPMQVDSYGGNRYFVTFVDDRCLMCSNVLSPYEATKWSQGENSQNG